MHFGLTEEQKQLRASVRGYLGELPHARAVLDGADPHDPAVWARIVAEQGWQAILIGEEEGGFGFGWVEMAVVLEELGRRLTPCPLLGTAFATAALLAGKPSDLRKTALSEIAEGTRAALALETDITATVSGGGWELSGVADAVVGGGGAEILVVDTFEGAFVVRSDEIRRENLPVLDVTRPLARLHFEHVALPGDAWLQGAETAAIRAGCEVLVACEAVGAAEAILEMAVEYAKVRQQFGRPIGSFQAIQHKCADMMVAVESARSAAWYAAWAVDSGADDARLAARTAKAMASQALMDCAGENIQIHGGIGFTWEHDAHLYFKRAQSTLGLLGSPQVHREAVAATLLGAEWT